MLVTIELLEIMIIYALSFYTLVGNMIFMVKATKTRTNNWELGVPGALIGFLMLAFLILAEKAYFDSQAQHAIRRAITIINMSIYASQVKWRDERCSD